MEFQGLNKIDATDHGETMAVLARICYAQNSEIDFFLKVYDRSTLGTYVYIYIYT